MGLGVLLRTAEPQNYLSLCDTLISMRPMRPCSALCMCEKDQGVCVYLCVYNRNLFLVMAQCIQANQTRNFYKSYIISNKRAQIFY